MTSLTKRTSLRHESSEADSCLVIQKTSRVLCNGPKRDEIIGGYRKLHNDELCNLYASPNTIRMIKPRRMTLAGHVARNKGEEECI
jgi:hypothetical protein